MNTGYIVLLAVLGYLFLSPFLSGLLGFAKRSRHAKKVRDETVPFINDRLGLVSCFCGQQGAGKSTMASGVANLLVEKLLADSTKRLDEIRRAYPSFDFTIVDSSIEFCFSKNAVNTDYIISAIFTADEKVRSTFQTGFYDDGINYTSNLDNFRDYIDSYLSLLRNNYCYFLNRQFYCRITKNYAMPLDYGSIAIKDRFLKRDYNLFRYSVLFQDEILLAGGSNSFWQSEASEDPGISDFFRLIRHIGKKTMYYIGTAQDFNRINKSRRELFNNIFEIFGHRNIITNKVRYCFYSSLESILKYLFRLVVDSLPKKSRKDFIGKHDQSFRQLLNKLELRKKQLESKWFLRYEGVLYSDPDDYLKDPETTLHPSSLFRLSFPLTYCYGCLNTYEYSSLHDVLSYESRDHENNHSFTGKPTMASREDFAKSVLKKISRKKSDFVKVSDQNEVDAWEKMK